MKAVTPLVIFGLILSAGAIATAQNVKDEMSDFNKRVDQIFRDDAGKPLKRAEKKPPLRKGRGNYTRAYSYSIVGFAARCFYLGEQIEEANAALAENAQHYLDNPKDIPDRDSFHWHADIVLRLIDMYGSKGSAKPGFLTPETEVLCLKPIWIYVKNSALYNKPDHATTKTWEFHSTENHHAMDFSAHWHFAKITKDHPEFRDLKFDDGSSIEDHYRQWSEYIVVYCRERAKKGTNIEIMCPGYNSVWLKGFYNFRDFGEPELKKSVDMLLDLYWAYWAQEQLNGVEGGGKTRIRGVNGFSHKTHGIPVLAWLYFGIGEEPKIINGEINAMLSDYEPPKLVADIAHNARKGGAYEIRQRAQGLGKQGKGDAIMNEGSKANKFRTDGGGIVRYSYCDPAFTIGCLMNEARPLEDWVHISAQSRWQGVIYSDSTATRIVPVVRPAGKARDVLNGHWSIQSKGTLITQKLKTNKAGGPMIVWMPEKEVMSPERDGDFVFVETEGAYTVIRVIGSDFELTDKDISNPSIEGPVRKAPPGQVIMPKNQYAPVIIDVIAKKECKDIEEFKRRAKACEVSMKDSVLTYTSLYGDKMTLDTKYKKVPTINGKPVDYSPPNVHESPFLNSVYDSGVVTISKGDQTKVLDFN